MNAITRKVRLIELLDQYKSMSVTDLALAINASDRTIRNDKNDINSLFNLDVIVSNGTSGYSLTNNYSQTHILSVLNGLRDTSGYSVEKLIYRSILFGKNVSISELSETCYLSESAIYSEIKDLSEKLLDKKIELIVQKKEVFIKGKEIDLRNLVINSMDQENEINQVIEELHHTDRMLFEEKFEKVKIKLQNSLTQHNIEKELDLFKRYFLVSFIRFNILNHPIDSHYIEINENEQTNEVKNVLENEGLEYQYLSTIYQYLTYSHNDENIVEETKIILNFLTDMDKMYNSQNMYDEKLIYDLAVHLKILKIQKYLGIKVNNPLLEKIKKEHSLAFEFAFNLSSKVESSFDLNLTDDEIGFIAVHIAAALERANSQASDGKNVLFISSFRESINFLCTEKIKKEFGTRVNLISVDLTTINTIDLEQVEYLIYTDKEQRDHLHFDIPKSINLIQVNPILTSKDIMYLYQVLFSRKKSNNREVIRNITNETCFVQGIKVKNKKQALDYITKHLEKSGNIDKTTLEGIYKREEISPTEIGNLVAIPHIVTNISSSTIGVYLLDEPIKWEDEFVQLVIPIIINETDIVSWETIFTWIYNYFIEDFGIKNLLVNFNYDYFIDSINY